MDKGSLPHGAISHRRISRHLLQERFSLLEYICFLNDAMRRFRTRGHVFACGRLAVAYEGFTGTLGVRGLGFDGVILVFHGMIWLWQNQRRHADDTR